MMKIERPPEPQIPARLPREPKAPSSPQAAAVRLRSLRQLAAFLSWRIYPENSTRIDTSAACFDDPARELLAHGHIVDDTAIISFRGTIGPFFVSTNWKNVNLRIKQIGNPPRHEGFHEGWMALRPTIDSWLKGTPFKTLILTGHSLGAALAQLAAHDFAAVFAIERVVFFAPPMVGGRSFNDDYSRTIVQATGERLASITEKYLLLSDVIGTPLPGYEHAEPLFPIDRKGRIMRAGKILRSLPISPSRDEMKTISNNHRVHRVNPFLVPEPVVDWGPPTRVDRVLARFRDFFLASGPWGWVGYAVLAVFNWAKRAFGFHNMAGYARAFGCDDLMKSEKLPDQIKSG